MTGPVADDPRLPDDITGRELDVDVLRELRSLPADLATRVAQHLVAVGELLDVDPELAYRHAQAARRRASRVAAVREAAGLAAYAAGHYAEALTDLRAARRMSGSQHLLPVIADSERGIGRPERALELASGPEVSRLDRAGRVELAIVVSGARRDLGQADAAVAALQLPELNKAGGPVFARLAAAYADALLDAGRREDALRWWQRAAEADETGELGAHERLAELEGVTFLTDDDEDDEEPGQDEVAADTASAGPGAPRARP